jgi:hypothetical protein
MATLQVNTGRAIVTGRIIGSTQPVPQYGGWGTGSGTTSATDTTLFTEASWTGYARATATMSQATTSTTNDTVQAQFTLTNNSGASQTITNAGLFDASSGGNLWVKGDFTGITLNPNDQITFTFKVQYQ